jgi:hypothetical protein
MEREKREDRAANEKKRTGLPVIDRKIVPAIREGIEMVMMVVFLKLRARHGEEMPDREQKYHSMLAAAVLNRIFGTTGNDGKVAMFVRENEDEIEKRTRSFASDFEELRILVTDALRMQFVCDEVEGIGESDENRAVLEKAVEYGILIQERDAPLPKGFMNLVYRVGVANGLIKPQTPETETDAG